MTISHILSSVNMNSPRLVRADHHSNGVEKQQDSFDISGGVSIYVNSLRTITEGKKADVAYCDSLLCDGVMCDAVCDAIICDGNVCDLVCDGVCDQVCDGICDSICDTVCDRICDQVCDLVCDKNAC